MECKKKEKELMMECKKEERKKESGERIECKKKEERKGVRREDRV